MVGRLQKLTIDIACLPVNGRDGWCERRRMTGNLDGREAGELAASIHAYVLISMHNDMFAANHVPLESSPISSTAPNPRQQCHWLQPL